LSLALEGVRAIESALIRPDVTKPAYS